MPRRARLVVAGIPWHIIQRGNRSVPDYYLEFWEQSNDAL